MSDISILLIEDNPTDRACIKEYLSEKSSISATLKEAESLQAALSLMSHYEFDLVLLDLGLPDSSGLNTARRIIAEYSDSAVIVLSDPDNEQTALQAVRYGAEDYLIKPSLSPAMLHKSITYAIERKKVLQEKYDVLSDLVLALEKIEYLESALPICAGCKKIYHEGKKHWMSLEKYVHQQANTRSSNPICSDCQAEFDSNS
jgi:DNA-binding response OmpR family regulator